jgi:glycosyltransferase involved in cell wall biosynthesis
MGGLQTGALMRVGFIIYGNLETLTGGYLYDRRLVDYLTRQGDQVEVISLSWRNYARHLSDNSSRALLRRLQNAKFDVLIQDELNHPSLFLINRWIKRHVSYPIVTLVHLLRCSESRSLWMNRLYRMIERVYFNTVNGAIFNSKTTRSVVEDTIRTDIPGVVAYPGGDHLNYGLPLEKIKERARQTGPLRMIFLGNVLPGKGLNILLEALARLSLDSWQLTVAGSLTMNPSYSDSIRNQISRAGLFNNVTLTGSISQHEVPHYLAQNQVMVVPSYYEAFGIAYLEAMGFGLPVIATTAGGAHEIIRHGQEGFLVSPGDVDSLAQYIDQMNRDRNKLFEMSLSAYERANNHPTWDESFASIREFLRSLAEKRATED